MIDLTIVLEIQNHRIRIVRKLMENKGNSTVIIDTKNY